MRQLYRYCDEESIPNNRARFFGGCRFVWMSDLNLEPTQVPSYFQLDACLPRTVVRGKELVGVTTWFHKFSFFVFFLEICLKWHLLLRRYLNTRNYF